VQKIGLRPLFPVTAADGAAVRAELLQALELPRVGMPAREDGAAQQSAQALEQALRR
jgi:hypothetical protein